MPRVLTAQEQRLLLLAAATYSSQSTHEVAIATQEMRKFILQNFPKSFSILQQLIILKEIDINTRKSIISHIKTVSFQIKQQLHNQSQHNFEILTNNKKFLYDIEHILANNQLEGTLKQPLAEAYVNIFVLFNPQTFEKLLSKARYYFNTKQDIVGINILESYHLSIAPFKYKYEFYSKLLPLVTDYILQRIKLPQNEIADNNKQIFYLNAHLNLLAEVWTSMNFQKYESIFCKELENQKLHQIFQIFLADQVPQHLLSYLYSIASHAISGLRRIGLYRKYQKFVRIAEAHLMYVLNKEIQSQFLLSKITEDYEVRSICGKLKFLISGVDIYNEGMQLIGYNFDIYAIFTKLVYPNFKNIQRYLYNHSNNPQEIFPFLQDISFEMKSDCPEVLIHKFTCSLGKNSKLVLADIKTLIYSFLFEFLPNNSNGKLKHLRFKYNLSQSLPFWPEISTFISLKEQLLSILAFTALIVTCFLNDIEFLNDLNDFMGQNAEFFMSSDPQVQFFSLLIFRNYRADIFSNNRASIFRALIIKKLLQTGNQSLNRKFIISIFEEQLEDVPDFDDIAFNILMIVDSMAHNFDQELHYILLLIFRNYQKELNKIDSIHKITASLVNVLEQRVQQPNHIKGMENYFQMIGFLLSSLNQQCSSQLFAKSLSIIEKTQYKIQIKGEKILNIVLQMLKKSGNIPASSEVILMSLKWQFQSIEILNSLTELIQYSQNQAFLNWIAHETTKEEFNIYSALLLHSLTYYKSLYLTYETLELLLLKIWSFNILHSHKQNYISGKLNIVCLFLLHSQKKMVYDILLNPKWRQIQAQINNQKKLNHLFTDSSASNTTGQLSFLDQFFHMLYYHENIYRWRFDIEVFLITQLKLFQTGLQDEIQLTYANLAMVACITNTIRAYSYFQVETSHFIPETDDQEVNCCQLDIQYERHLTMMQQFNRPQQFKEDYFLLLKRWVNKLKRTQNSNKWFKTILSQMFSEQNRAIFDSILHTERCQGSKFRNVVKIQRIKGQDYQ